jgi:hypothetical protein
MDEDELSLTINSEQWHEENKKKKMSGEDMFHYTSPQEKPN